MIVAERRSAWCCLISPVMVRRISIDRLHQFYTLATDWDTRSEPIDVAPGD